MKKMYLSLAMLNGSKTKLHDTINQPIAKSTNFKMLMQINKLNNKKIILYTLITTET